MNYAPTSVYMPTLKHKQKRSPCLYSVSVLTIATENRQNVQS